jgi:steroid delta-isomerase-like uncharacterized protein
MTRQEIMSLFTRRDQSFKDKNVAGLIADFAEDAVVESPMQGKLTGRAQIGDLYRQWFSAFPDFKYTMTDAVIEDHRAAQFFTISGTQATTFGGIPATGRKVHFNVVGLFTFDDAGLITHERRLYDVTAVLVQLGALKTKVAE